MKFFKTVPNLDPSDTSFEHSINELLFELNLARRDHLAVL